MTNKEKIRFCNEISKMARIIFKDYNLCQITEKGCLRHTFEEKKELCCIHCDHLKVGIGCKVHTISCSTGGCFNDWISSTWISQRAISFFGEDKIEVLEKLQLLRKCAEVITEIRPLSRCSNTECFDEEAQEIEDKRWKRYINKSN
jgi:hypothetical protein